MDLDQLHTFLEIVRLKSFSKAAQACFRTQPAVSAQVRQLEQELNTSLFERLGTRIALTPAGRILQEYAEQLGKKTSATSVAALYQDFVDVFILDSYDEYLSSAISTLVPTVRTAPTLMDSTDSQIRLAILVDMRKRSSTIERPSVATRASH